MKVRLLVILLFTLFIVSVSAAGEKLFVHYYRFDESYEEWNLWIWPHQPESLDSDGPEDGAYPFTGEDDFGVYAEIDLDETNLANSTTIGIIVRTADWAKDISFDRFIDMSNTDAEGNVHVYLVQANETMYYELNEVDKSNKIFSANFIDDNTIEFSATAVADTEKIKIYENDTEFPIEVVYDGGTTRRLDVAAPIDLNKEYTLEIDFGEIVSIDIGLSGLYTTDTFNDQFAYDEELGAIYTNESTTFRLWSPVLDAVNLNLYNYGHDSSIEDYDNQPGDDIPYASYEMTKLDKGVWEVTVPGDLDGKYYTYTVNNDGQTYEVVDPYAVTTGVNGDRGMIIDLSSTNPIGWGQDSRPTNVVDYQDSIIYELHVRDLTTHSSWNGPDEYRGKYLGLTMEGTEYNDITTGLDHLKELGVTTIHLLPVFDYGIVDETRLNDETYKDINDGIFNWGYMPENFNTPEGSYSTDPYNGDVRVAEFKEMVQAFHNAGLRVVMDVVYNHTGLSANSKWNLIFPGYYYRMNGDNFSNGSGTGNETASERYMFQKYIVDSTVYWASEYHIDGFRFDLMKLHDVETMNKVAEALHEIDESIIVYGEPWDAGGSSIDGSIAASKDTLSDMPNIAIFNDATRDGIKGSVFDAEAIGFVQGNNFMDDKLMIGILAGSKHDSIPLMNSYTISPSQNVNYVTAHDNNTLYDKLKLSTTSITEAEITYMQKQANAIVLTSQGISFLHAGVDFMRTKPCIDGECDADELYDHNSYRSPDGTNQLDWTLKEQNIDVFNYYKGLIELRNSHPAFRLETAEEIQNGIEFIDEEQGGLVQYLIKNNAGGDDWQTIMVVHNNNSEKEISLLNATWNVVVNRDTAGVDTIEQVTGTLMVKPNETLVMYVMDDIMPPTTTDAEPTNNIGVIIASSIFGVVLIGYLFTIKKGRVN